MSSTGVLDTPDVTGAQPSPAPAPTKRAEHRRRSSLAPRRVFLAAFVLVFFVEAAWSYATPIFGAPDEPSHVVKAAAVVRGELLGNLAEGPSSPMALVQVPAFYALLRWPAADPAHSQICFHARATTPASCAQSVNAPASLLAVKEGATREAWIYTARYPPLYYAIVGWPTLLGQSSWVIYLMRLVSAAASALFIALAFTVALAWSKNRFLVLGLLVATTPMVVFLGGVINPSGLEIASAMACWTALLVLATEHDGAPPTGLIVVAGASAAVFEATRGISPFWLALTVLVVVAIADRATLGALVKDRRVQYGIAAVGIVGIAAVVWILKEHATLVYSAPSAALGATVPTSTILESSFQHNTYYLPDMIGVFGWFDTWSPTFTYVAWYGLVGALGLLGAVAARRRQAIVLGLVALGIVVIPVLISSSQARQHGYVWSGRDALPFAIGLPLLAATLLGSRLGASARPIAPRAVGVVGGICFVATFAAFFEALRRYAVGTLGPDFGWVLHPDWRPPIGIAATLIGEVVVLGASYVLVWRATSRRVESEADPRASKVPADHR